MLNRLTLAALLCASPLFSQALTPARLSQLQAGCAQDPSFRALRNALAQEDSRKLALDWDRIAAVDGHFSKRLPDEPVADQKASGRCWMFSGLNLFRRAAAARLGCETVEFSQNYLFFYDKLEKANLYLDAVERIRERPYSDRRLEFLLNTPVQEGGNWQGFVDLVKKYGVVPKEAMPETFSSSKSASMNHALKLRLQVAGLKIRAAKDPEAIAAIKQQALQDAYRILAMHLGVPPTRFSWRFIGKDKQLTPLKSWTPLEFSRDAIGAELDSYVAIYAIPTLATGRKFSIDLDRALLDASDMVFVNCPLETLKEAARKCLLADRPVWFGADVSNDMVREDGLMLDAALDYRSLYGMDFDLDRKGLFETHRSSPNHNMVFTGIDIEGGKPVKWLVENSWGDKNGKKGYFTMLDGWFDRYVDVVVVPRSFLAKEVLDVFATQAEVLPPWDPMMGALTFE